MSISGMLVVGVPPSVSPLRAVAPPFSLWVGGGGVGRGRELSPGGGVAGTGMMPSVVQCSSRPKKKATSHHMKTRPKKTQPWDVRRKGPTAYPPLPPLPPDWTLASSQQEEQQGVVTSPPPTS
uniref:50S ribosomal protein 6, chloroplastic n=1 Tax=Anthurium amnicola TaxID=1678845 RepID=A0A1D1XF73_9ARAE